MSAGSQAILDPIPQAVRIVTDAINADKDGEYEKALGLYTRSLDLFVKGIEYEKNQSARVRLLPPRRERDSHARSLFAHTRVLSFARLSCFSPFAGSLHPCTPPSRTTFVQCYLRALLPLTLFPHSRSAHPPPSSLASHPPPLASRSSPLTPRRTSSWGGSRGTWTGPSS